MATISMSYCLLGKNQVTIKEHKNIIIPKTSSLPLSCQSRKPTGEEDSKEKPLLTIQVVSGLSKFGTKLKENLGPKQKGDWKDVLLMSISFGVYVYISQKIVCAYCAWMSMLNHSS